MSQFNRRGYTTVNVKGKGGIQVVAIKKGGKMERIARHRAKQVHRAQKTRVREYKKNLREAKKRVPLAERSHIRLEDL